MVKVAGSVSLSSMSGRDEPCRPRLISELQQLYWLPIEGRIIYQVCVLMYRGVQQQYLSELCDTLCTIGYVL